MPAIRRGDASIAYTRAGAGPAVLLLQGAGVIGRGWRPQVEALASRFTVLTVDNRGLGDSTAGSARLSIDAMAEDALAIMDAERIDRAHVAGHSMGGLIAQHLALTARRRVASLALMCTFLRGAEGARMTPAMLVTALRMRIGSRAMRRKAFLQLVMPAAYLNGVDIATLAGDLQDLFGYDLASQPGFVFKQVQAMARYDASGRLHELAGLPTLVLSASEDRIALPAFGRALAAAIPGARYVEWKAAGHAVTIQCADGINALLADHLADAERRAGERAP